MDLTLAEFIELNTSFDRGEEIFIDETASENRNCILVRVMDAASTFVGLNISDVAVVVTNVDFSEARRISSELASLFDGRRGIDSLTWGVIGNIVSRYEGTDTMKRTVYSILFKIGIQED